METKHIEYSYKKYTTILLVSFLLALIIPRAIYSLRYSELRILWQIGTLGSLVFQILTVIFSIINSIFTFFEFWETKKWNLFWLILSLIPLLFWVLFFLFNF
ncbi:MAG TPA: hypothetical protein DCP54_08610 [Chryseobacterium sp.]|nr:hypothetical protein [Chryseobacterium sp.]